MMLIDTPGLEYLAFEKLNQQPNLRHGISLRQAGPTERTIEKTTRALGWKQNSLIRPQQIHSAKIAVVRQPGQHVGRVDGVCTIIKNVPIALVGADCPLILAYDPENQALGLAHAGWRGTAQKIAMELLRHMKIEFGSDPRQMKAGIGPAICPNCYEVGPEVADIFQKQFENTQNYLFKIHPDSKNATESVENNPTDKIFPKWSLDLSKANQIQLIREGMPGKNIEISEYCTFEQKKWFYSYRREGPKTGRNALLAGLI